MAKPGFYAVKVGKKPGIYLTWAEASPQVDKWPGAKHKKLPTRAQAEDYMSSDEPSYPSARPQSNFKRPHEDLSSSTANPTTKKKKSKENVFVPNSAHGRVVYCDGSALGNGKANSTAGSGVFWSHEPELSKLNISERLPGELQTNNRAEMFAIARVLEVDPHPELPLTICTDSAYSIGAFSLWIPGWRRRNWRTSSGEAVQNKDLILYVLALIALRQAKVAAFEFERGVEKKKGMATMFGGGGVPPPTSNIIFQKVKAHVGIEGNEEADRYAKNGADMAQARERDFEKDRLRVEAEAREVRKETRRRQKALEVEVEMGTGNGTKGEVKEVLVIDDDDGDEREQVRAEEDGAGGFEVDLGGLLTKEELAELERTQDF